MSQKVKKPSKKILQQIEDVYEKYHGTGTVCWIALDHFVASDLKEFAEQPADSLIYDLGLLPENTHILAKNGDIDFDDYVEKIAYSEVIKYLSLQLQNAREEIDKLKKEKQESND